MMEVLQKIFETLRHLNPESVNDLAVYLGPWLYVVLFAIIFAETGLVITPFLPGDSLLFAIGAMTALNGSSISLTLMAILLIVAAILGDAVNYAIGRFIGPRIFASERLRLLNKKHLLSAQAFYEKHGSKTIILARFVPIVRTFAPFVAGIGRMNYARFAAYNVVGGIVWVLIFLLLGRWFGGLEFVNKHFEKVVFAIVLISILPPVVEYLRSRTKKEDALPTILPKAEEA